MCKFILTLELPVGVFISSAVYQCLEMTVVILYIFSHALSCQLLSAYLCIMHERTQLQEIKVDIQFVYWFVAHFN